MNGKKARLFRQKALHMTIGMPYAEYTTGDGGESILTDTCTKGVYRKLKKEYLEKKRARGKK